MEKKLKNRSSYFVKIGFCIVTSFHFSMSEAQNLEVNATSHQLTRKFHEKQDNWGLNYYI